MIQEDIRLGERVRQYILEYKHDDAWKKLACGSCIGHKRIHKFRSIQTDAVRLRLTSSVAGSAIKDLSVYFSQRCKTSPEFPKDSCHQ